MLLTETGGAAPAVSHLISRLLFYGSLGPNAWFYLNEPVSISPKAEPEARTLVQTLYVEDNPGSRREGIGEEWKGGRRNQPKSALASVYFWKVYRIELSASQTCPPAPTPPQAADCLQEHELPCTPRHLLVGQLSLKASEKAMRP